MAVYLWLFGIAPFYPVRVRLHLRVSQRLYTSSLVKMVRVQLRRLRVMSVHAVFWVSRRSGSDFMMDDDADGRMSTGSQEEGC